jgi:hypothetical protein
MGAARKKGAQVICLKSGYIFNNFKQNDCQRFTEFRILAFVLLSNCYSHTKIAALGGGSCETQRSEALSLSTVATTTVAHGSPELVVFV